MVPANFCNEYRRNEVSTSSQGKLILMMYEGAIKFAKLAIKSEEENQVADKHTHIRKTHDIINELACCLDMEKGGEISTRLDDLYQFMLRQLTLANIKSNTEALESVLNVLTILHEAWDEAINRPQLPTAEAAPAPAKNITAQF